MNMTELDDFDIKKGSHVVIKDGTDEHIIIKEGNTAAFKEIAGTNVVRIELDTGDWIECTKVL